MSICLCDCNTAKTAHHREIFIREIRFKSPYLKNKAIYSPIRK